MNEDMILFLAVAVGSYLCGVIEGYKMKVKARKQ